MTSAYLAEQRRGLFGVTTARRLCRPDETVCDLRQRRHDDDGRPGAGVLRLPLAADDVDDARHRDRIGDGRTAELHDNGCGSAHSRPSSRISSALRIAAPAAPRIVL